MHFREVIRIYQGHETFFWEFSVLEQGYDMSFYRNASHVALLCDILDSHVVQKHRESSIQGISGRSGFPLLFLFLGFFAFFENFPFGFHGCESLELNFIGL